MLPKKNRLNKKQDFREVLGLKKFLHGRFFAVAIKKTQGETKMGVIVSNKVSKKAVERNKIKRVVRDVSRILVEKFPKGQGVVVIAKASARDKTKQELEKDINQVFTKIT